MTDELRVCSKCKVRKVSAAFWARRSQCKACEGYQEVSESAGACRHCSAPYRRVPLGAVPTCDCWEVRLVTDAQGAVMAVRR